MASIGISVKCENPGSVLKTKEVCPFPPYPKQLLIVYAQFYKAIKIN
jgi:hypothetical protein